MEVSLEVLVQYFSFNRGDLHQGVDVFRLRIMRVATALSVEAANLALEADGFDLVVGEDFFLDFFFFPSEHWRKNP